MERSNRGYTILEERTPMMYLRFAGCLAFGLFGVALFLMAIFDSILVDWDITADIRSWFRSFFHQEKYGFEHADRAIAEKKKARVAGQFLAGSENSPFKNRDALPEIPELPLPAPLIH